MPLSVIIGRLTGTGAHRPTFPRAWKRTSRRLDASSQVMRIAVLRWIHSQLRPSQDFGLGPVAALLPDQHTQAYRTGVLAVRRGVNSPYHQHSDDAETAWNGALD